MGAEVQTTEQSYILRTPRLRGERLILDYPSHTGTENLLMAACLANGVTYIQNASVEPEVVDLADFLSAMGARIHGAGTSTIQVEGSPSTARSRLSRHARSHGGRHLCPWVA